MSRIGLASGRVRHADLRDLQAEASDGGLWVRFHGASGEREVRAGDLLTSRESLVDVDGLEAGLTAVMAARAESQLPDDVTDPGERQTLIDIAVNSLDRLDYEHELGGFGVGFDLFRGEDGGRKWAVGGTVGYQRSRTSFDDHGVLGAGGRFDADTVSTGVYASLMTGGLYADLAVAWAWHSVDLDMPLMNLRPAGSVIGVDGSSLAAQLELSWRPTPADARFYFEPVAGLDWVRLTLDDANVQPGDSIVLGRAGSRLSFDGEESLRGNFGVRIGSTPWEIAGLLMQVELGWRAWREFQGETRANIALRGHWLDLTDPDAEAQLGHLTLPAIEDMHPDSLTELTLGGSLRSPDGRLSAALQWQLQDASALENQRLSLAFRYQW